MYYGNIKKTDIANGTGVRVSLFVSADVTARTVLTVKRGIFAMAMSSRTIQ